MGTAGITHFHESDVQSPVICHVYKQSDGYPESLGEQIKAVFGDAQLRNGIRFDLKNQVNGMGCAAAQFIAAAKDGVGGIYMLREAPSWADYDYHIFHEGRVPTGDEPSLPLQMKIVSGAETLWQGRISDFDSAALYEDEGA